MYLAQQKFELERELKVIEANLAREKHAAEMQMKAQQHEQSLQLAAVKHVQGEHAKAESAQQASETHDHMAKQNEALTSVLKQMTAPKKATRGKDGSITIEVQN